MCGNMLMSSCEKSEVGGNKGIIELSLSGRDYYIYCVKLLRFNVQNMIKIGQERILFPTSFQTSSP